MPKKETDERLNAVTNGQCFFGDEQNPNSQKINKQVLIYDYLLSSRGAAGRCGVDLISRKFFYLD